MAPVISVAATGLALLALPANTTPGAAVASIPAVHNVRLVCDDYGRCYREHDEDVYDAPPPRPRYDPYDDDRPPPPAHGGYERRYYEPY